MELPSHISFHPILLSTKKRRDIDIDTGRQEYTGKVKKGRIGD
jgi:hypothetical protein